MGGLSDAKLCDFGNLMLGALLIFSSWMFGFTAEPQSLNALLSGIILAAVSTTALAAFAAWEERLNLAVGLWLIVSPWVLSFQSIEAVRIEVTIGNRCRGFCVERALVQVTSKAGSSVAAEAGKRVHASDRGRRAQLEDARLTAPRLVCAFAQPWRLLRLAQAKTQSPPPQGLLALRGIDGRRGGLHAKNCARKAGLLRRGKGQLSSSGRFRQTFALNPLKLA